jgi:hypothetical protein
LWWTFDARWWLVGVSCLLAICVAVVRRARTYVLTATAMIIVLGGRVGNT